MYSKIACALALVLVCAHGSFGTDMISKHGGRMAEAGDYHLEMVAKASAVDVYLSDHKNKSITSTGHKGVAILLVEGKSQRIVLEPAGEARLSGKATAELPGTPKGVVQITLPNGKTVQGRFN